MTPNADLTEFTITDVGVIELLLPQRLSAPKAMVTPAGSAGYCTIPVRLRLTLAA